jgi:ribosomal protein S18 acetylase RimI-like enzyme
VLQIRAICMQISRQKGRNIVLKSVVLQTSARNFAALKFYEVCGYQRQELLAGYYGGVRLFNFSNINLRDETRFQ